MAPVTVVVQGGPLSWEPTTSISTDYDTHILGPKTLISPWVVGVQRWFSARCRQGAPCHSISIQRSARWGSSCEMCVCIAMKVVVVWWSKWVKYPLVGEYGKHPVAWTCVCAFVQKGIDMMIISVDVSE